MYVSSRYEKRISRPLLDRIDIHIEVQRVDATLRAVREPDRRPNRRAFGGYPRVGRSGARTVAATLR